MDDSEADRSKTVVNPSIIELFKAFPFFGRLRTILMFVPEREISSPSTAGWDTHVKETLASTGFDVVDFRPDWIARAEPARLEFGTSNSEVIHLPISTSLGRFAPVMMPAR
jgi:hypothetical protein